MSGAWQDIRFGFRTLRRGWLVTAAAAVCLAIGVAANVTIFSVINGLFFRPLPYPEPERIVFVGERHPSDTNVLSTAAPGNFLDWRSAARSFSRMAAFRSTAFGLGEPDRQERVPGAFVTPGFFEVLGRRAETGRLFTEEDLKGEGRMVVIGHDLARRLSGGTGGLVGDPLRIDGEVHTIVGVLAEDFDFLGPDLEVWAPLDLRDRTEERDQKGLIVVARLRGGVSTAEAGVEMDALGDRLAREFPDANRDFETEVLNLREDYPGDRNRQVFGLLQGAMLFVLLIACTNVGSLLAVKLQLRRDELALRQALGASRPRIVRQLVAESLMLAGLGGALGIILAVPSVNLIEGAMAGTLPRHYAPAIDLRVLTFAVGLTLVAGLVFAIAPALGARSSLSDALKEHRGTRAPRRRLTVSALVVAETAMALALLGGAAILVQSFVAIQTADPGFEPEGLSVAEIRLPTTRYEAASRQLAFHRDLLDRVGVAPGVTGAALASRPPRSPLSPNVPFEPLGGVYDEQQPPRASSVVVTPGYPAALGVSVLDGRFFDTRDGEEGAAVAVVSYSLARRSWPGTSAVDREIVLDDRPHRVIGVMSDVRQELTLGEERDDQSVIYLPLAQNPRGDMALLLRSETELGELGAVVREITTGIDPELPVPDVSSFDQYLTRYTVGAQVFTGLLGGFGLVALVLAALGIYSIVAYSVASRTREIGLRMALGARRPEILRLLLIYGLRLAVIGLLLGAPAVYGLSRLIRSTMAGLVTVSFEGLAVAVAVLGATLLLACLVPATRATRIDPAANLRAE